MTSWRNLFLPSEKYVPGAIRSLKAKEDFYILGFEVYIQCENLNYEELEISLQMQFNRPDRAKILDHFPKEHENDQTAKTRHATLWDSGFFNKNFPGILTSNLYEDSVSVHPGMTLHLTDVPGLTGLISLEQDYKKIFIGKNGDGWMWQLDPGDNNEFGCSQLVLQTLSVPKQTKKAVLECKPFVAMRIPGRQDTIRVEAEMSELAFSFAAHRDYTPRESVVKI